MPPTTRYTTLLQKHLPAGDAWPRDEDTELFELLDGLGVEFSRVEQRALDLIEEIDPRTTSELLDDWERVCGLPGDNPNPPATTDARRAALLEHLRGLGAPSITNINALLEAISSWYSYRDYEYFSPFVPGSTVGQSLTQDEWQHTVRLHLESLDNGGENDLAVEWLLTRIMPAHVLCLVQWIGAFSVDVGENHTLNAVATNGFRVWVSVGSVASSRNILRTTYDGFTESTTKIQPDGSLTTLYTVVYDPIYDTWWAAGDRASAGQPPQVKRSADGGVTWVNVTPDGGSNVTLKGSAHDGAGIVILVGSNGIIQRIDSGFNFNAYSAGSSYTGTFQAAAFADSLFVAVGTAGEVQSSSDGITWTSRTPGGFAGELRAVHYSDGLWVAVGDDGEVQTSADGLTWARHTSNVFSTDCYAVTKIGEHWWVSARSATTYYRTTDPTDPDSWDTFDTDFPTSGWVWDGRWLAAANISNVGIRLS